MAYLNALMIVHGPDSIRWSPETWGTFPHSQAEEYLAVHHKVVWRWLWSAVEGWCGGSATTPRCCHTLGVRLTSHPAGLIHRFGTSGRQSNRKSRLPSWSSAPSCSGCVSCAHSQKPGRCSSPVVTPMQGPQRHKVCDTGVSYFVNHAVTRFPPGGNLGCAAFCPGLRLYSRLRSRMTGLSRTGWRMKRPTDEQALKSAGWEAGRAVHCR